MGHVVMKSGRGGERVPGTRLGEGRFCVLEEVKMIIYKKSLMFVLRQFNVFIKAPFFK